MVEEGQISIIAKIIMVRFTFSVVTLHGWCTVNIEQDEKSW